MNKNLVFVGFGLVVFLGAAGGSWYVQNVVLAPKTQSDEHSSQLHPAVADAQRTPDASQSTTKVAMSDFENAPATGDAKQRLPVPIRPREMSVEELLRLGMGVKERENTVRLQEEQLQKRRVQQQLAQADIEGERKEIEGLRVQVQDQLKQAEVLIEKMSSMRSQLLQDQTDATANMQQIKHERVEIDLEQQENTKRLSQWIQSMDPEKAAEVLKSMADDGAEELEIAVQILRNLEEREAAKILSAIDDPKLVQTLIEKFRKLKKAPPKSTAKR
ncbi:hypothetical protein SH668x_000395 [Planctomicrobium sp. SH668]|uniref:hypothetical protein n=1 Tax=Planctomicrobium sp. SH668 TaxID=3448126 RepID=UPI003F5B7C19